MGPFDFLRALCLSSKKQYDKKKEIGNSQLPQVWPRNWHSITATSIVLVEPKEAKF